MIRDPEKTGIVYLVGAGPGHPGLITRMGYDLLQQCDAVAYDALIPLELIASLPERVERCYVGRRAGRHSMPQAEKNRLLVDLALRGLRVVRLKGGDTSFFGGSAEEAESLAAAGIPVVVVPGVTAASAVAAASGLPLTDRRGASWVFFATGHGSDSNEIPVPWHEIAALRGGTLVIYMGLANLDQLVNQLLEGGHPGDMPCMIVQGASTGVQRILTSKLGDIVEDCRREKLKPPALFVVGQVVQHRTPACSASVPLAGKRILVTCCAQETEKVCVALRNRGAEPFPYPTCILEECDDAAGWARFPGLAAGGGWCLFASEPEVHAFVNALLRRRLDLRALGKLKIAAFGRKTEAALLQKNILADRTFQSSQQAFSRRDLNEGAGSKPENLVIFSEEMKLAKTEWREVLRLNLFRTKPAPWESHWLEEIRNRPPDFILFRNPAEVDGFVNVFGQKEACDLARRSKLIVADEAAAAAHRHGLHFSPDTGNEFSDIY
jgi:uroporphyrinogen III methyltransferase/synthase